MEHGDEMAGALGFYGPVSGLAGNDAPDPGRSLTPAYGGRIGGR